MDFLNATIRWLVLILAIVVVTGCVTLIGTVFQRVLFAREPLLRLGRLGTSIISGCLASLASVCIALIIGVLDTAYVWSSQSLLAIGAVGLVPGLIVTLGTYWQLFVAGKYKGYLYHKLEEDQQRRPSSKDSS